MAEPLALYDQSVEIRAWWIGENIWDLDLSWLGYVYDGHAFAADGSTWLGPVKEGVMMDRSGRVVLWNPDAEVSGEVSPYSPPRPPRPPRPNRPPRPYMPPRPYKPPRPAGGWTNLTFDEWLMGGLTLQPVSDGAEAGQRPNEISFDDE